MPYEEEIPPGGELMEPSAELDGLCHGVIGAAIEVHRELGPGLPEEVYQRAMQVELANRRIPFEAQKPIDIFYKGVWSVKGGLIFWLIGYWLSKSSLWKYWLPSVACRFGRIFASSVSRWVY